jgi:hypothetical protein
VNNSGWWGVFFAMHPPLPPLSPSFLFVYLFIYSLPKGIFSLTELAIFSKLSVEKFQNIWHVSISPFIFILFLIHTLKKKVCFMILIIMISSSNIFTFHQPLQGGERGGIPGQLTKHMLPSTSGF